MLFRGNPGEYLLKKMTKGCTVGMLALHLRVVTGSNPDSV